MGQKIPQLGYVCILVLLATITQVNSYTKYGRTCSDIGCLPSEVCTMAADSCQLGQQNGKDCGTYPTCQKSSTSKNVPGVNLNPAPENTRFSQQPDPQPKPNYPNPSYNPQPTPINTNYIFGSPQNPNVNPNNWPIFPAGNPPTQQPPYYQFPQANYPLTPQGYPQGSNRPTIILDPNFHQNHHNFYNNPPPSTKSPSGSIANQFWNNKRKNSSHRATGSSILVIFTASLIALIFHQTSYIFT